MTAETIYSFVPVILIVIAAGAFWHLYRNFSRAEVLSRPGSLSRGQLKNVIGFARMTMKNTRPGTPRHEDAQRRHDAAQAELDRRSRG
jgi:hypothetical protein